MNKFKKKFKAEYSAYRKELRRVFWVFSEMRIVNPVFKRIYFGNYSNPLPLSLKIWQYYSNKGNKQMCNHIKG